MKKWRGRLARGSWQHRGIIMVTKVLHLAAALVAACVLLGGTAIAQKIPAPEEALGFKVGADFHLATYQQAYKYFKSLEQVSPMIRIVEVGKTPMGNPLIYAVITSQANMAKLDRYQEITRRLSLVRGLTDDQARALAAEGKVVVYIDGGLHADECAPAQHNIQLAYDILTGSDPATRAIRDNVILILVFANPDGMDMLAEWYHPNVGTPYEVSPMPWLYNKYVGHDNNRDSFMGNMLETQYLNKIANELWFPEVLYNHHQTAPFPARIWIHPGAEPQLSNVHPLLVRWQNLFGTAMGAAFDRAGQDGAISRTVFDSWYPGYVSQVADGHNIISQMTETALFEYATPHFYTVSDFPEAYRDFTVSTFYPSPWKGGWWRLGDAVEYCLTASKAVLQLASAYRQELLFDKYQMGRDTIARFKKEPPYAWIIPQQQGDLPTAVVMLTRLKKLAIDIYQADKPFTSDGLSYPAGTWIIPMTQPFALFAKSMLEEQKYPDLTKYPDAWQGLVSPQVFKDAYLPPYDMAGWTLQYQMGVKVVAANSPLDVPMTPVDTPVAPPAKVEGSGATYVLSPRINNSFIAVNRILKQGGEVYRSREPLTVGSETYPPGAYIVQKGLAPAAADSLAKELSVPIAATTRAVPPKSLKLKAPRVALYRSWVGEADEGWIRWLLEQFEFPCANVHDAEMRAGELKENYDVLVIPAMETETIVGGYKIGTVPPRYAGGITEAGVRNIKKFVENGGTLVLVNDAGLFGIEKLALPVTDVLKDLRARRRWGVPETKPPQFACPGSVLRIEFDPKHPVAFGMPEEAPGVCTSSVAFRLNPSFDGKTPETVAKYPGGSLLMSGYLKGEQFIQNTVAAADVPLGKGRVILLGFGVEQRGQPHGTFKLLFNSLYYGAATAAQ
jgi:hypothetical protein